MTIGKKSPEGGGTFLSPMIKQRGFMQSINNSHKSDSLQKEPKTFSECVRSVVEFEKSEPRFVPPMEFFYHVRNLALLLSKYDHLLNDEQWLWAYNTFEARRITLFEEMEVAGFDLEHLPKTNV